MIIKQIEKRVKESLDTMELYYKRKNLNRSNLFSSIEQIKKGSKLHLLPRAPIQALVTDINTKEIFFIEVDLKDEASVARLRNQQFLKLS